MVDDKGRERGVKGMRTMGQRGGVGRVLGCIYID